MAQNIQQNGHDEIVRQIQSLNVEIRPGKSLSLWSLRHVMVPEAAYAIARKFLKWAPNITIGPDNKPLHCRFKCLYYLNPSGESIYSLLMVDAGNTTLADAGQKIEVWKEAIKSLLRYALNLKLAPKRPEFQQMKLSCSYYVYQVAKKLQGAEKILLCMGYEPVSGSANEIQELKYGGEVNTWKVIFTAADLVILHSELDRIHDLVVGAIQSNYINVTLRDILEARGEPNDTLASTLQRSLAHSLVRIRNSRQAQLSQAPAIPPRGVVPQRQQSAQLKPPAIHGQPLSLEYRRDNQNLLPNGCRSSAPDVQVSGQSDHWRQPPPSPLLQQNLPPTQQPNMPIVPLNSKEKINLDKTIDRSQGKGIDSAKYNALGYVPLEEPHDQFINPHQIQCYIGEEKGIQGHQNSCYLDSTVFGLFAVSDIFDSMFLQQQNDDPDGDEVKYLLWKGIVNPLRKNGVVRYESVMKLRNKLEELGKMKGILNQDEKDPEEFLNMLFKHTLRVPPFISIKHPFGVEGEYFVQLFIQRDESLKLPTIGDLLKRMFNDQKILFTKVPSKLLIQVPRFLRDFRFYEKVIPGTKLKVRNLLCSNQCCFMCGDHSAWKKCFDCASHFTAKAATPIIYFCENCAKLAHGHATKRDKHAVSDVTTGSDDLTGLELLSVICIETSHYVCFTRSEDRWVFFDSMANRVNDMYNIPKVVDCTDVLTEWVYPANGDLTRLLNTPPRELPEYVRRFTQDIYLCVYIQPDFAMYGDFEDDVEDYHSEEEYKQPEESNKATGVDTMQQEFDELKTEYALLQQQQEKLQQECTQLKDELVEKEEREQARHQQELKQIQCRHQQEFQQVQDQYQRELQQVQDQHQRELQQMAAEKQSVEQRLENRILGLERKLETANTEVKEVRFTQLLNPQGADSSWNVPRNEVMVKEEIGRGASGLVSKGQFRGQNVAVKQIHQFILSQKHVMNEFKREVRIMASVQHPNLVQFIGAVFDESVKHLTATPLLLLELLHTNLRKAYEQRPSNLGTSVMLSIFRDMAYGLHYLHEHQEPIIHRDVSAPNVLLEALPGGTWRAKLSDFGSANFLKRSSTLGVGAIICTAPEMFPRDDPSAPVPRPTVKCDVFSYGIVLVEVVTKTMPSLENRHQLFQEVERKWKMMHDLVTRCTQRRPEDRPTMSVVLNLLNRFPVARPR